MALELIEKLDGRILEIKVEGQLSREDYERFVAEAERLISQHGKIRTLFDFRKFEGWGAEILWNNLNFDIAPLKDVERVALIGETDQQNWMAAFGKPFSSARIQYFEGADLETAWKWLEDAPIRVETRTAAAGTSSTSPEGKPSEAPSEGSNEGAGQGRLMQLWIAWRKKVLIALALSVVGLIGLGLEYIMEFDTWWYWFIILPLFGIAAVRLDLDENKASRDHLWPEIKKQLIHWVGVVLALQMIYILIRTEALAERRDSGLVSLMMLALACYFGGLHLNNVFYLVALILAGVFVLVAYSERYFWLIFVLFLAAVGFLYAYQKWFAKGAKSKAKQAESTGS